VINQKQELRYIPDFRLWRFSGMARPGGKTDDSKLLQGITELPSTGATG